MKHVFCWAVLGILTAGIASTFVGCTDMGYADDVANLQNQQRINRGIPGPTELPPGLGDDLPAPQQQPVATNK